jgi:D-alanyl-D-alanine carboxypeptidase/D-alanyl-D-alanine-endopeptidase (penicillin-binding protein 4)
MPVTPPNGQPPAAGGGSTPTSPGSPGRRRGLIIGAIALAFVLLGTGAVFLGINVGRNNPLPILQANSPKRSVPGTEVQPTQIPTCSLDSLASAPGLIKLYGSVVNTSTGQSVYANGDTTGVRPAGVLKILTAAAAISALGPTYQITTTVYQASTPGTIVLVGQGDPTLSRVPAGQSIYAGAPTLATLASKTLAAYQANPANFGVPIQNLILDSTYWDPNDNWDSSVPTSERGSGQLSEITALQVDGDRANPHLEVSPRSNDPVTAAGNAFVTALGLNPSDVTVTEAANPSGSTLLASVQSQPVSTLVRQMLQLNDNTLAETLTRVISVKESLGGSSSSIQSAITTALQKFGLDTSDLTIEDGSGSSDESQVPPLFMSKFMSLVSQKSDGLQFVAAGLALSGKSGELANRFKGSNAIVAGKISGKAGALSNAYTLTGYLTAADGTGESFAFFAEGDGITSAASPALDSLAAAVYTCGKNITNN